MANKRMTDFPVETTLDPDNDLFLYVDKSDTSSHPDGTNKATTSNGVVRSGTVSSSTGANQKIGDALDARVNKAGGDASNTVVDSSTGVGQTLSEALDQRVIYVDTIADLQALPTSELVDGRQIHVKEYNAGTGVGGGGFYWDATNNDTDNDGTIFAVSGVTTGRFIRSNTQTITPRHFGAIDGGLAQENAIEAYFNWAGENAANGHEYRMAHDGDYYVSRGVVIESCDSASFSSDSRLIIRPPSGQYINDPGVRLYSVQDGNWGRIQVLGDSGGGGFRHGVLGTRIRRGKFAGLGGNYCRLFGVAITSRSQPDDIPSSPNNNNGSIISKVDSAFCGSQTGYSIAFTETSRNYSARNENQTSTLSVNLDDYYPTPARGTPFMFGGQAFVVLSYDSAAQEATVYPCMDADPEPLVSGSLILLPGGGLCLSGSDAGQLRTEQVNVRFSSVGISLQSAYGGTTKGLTSQFNGIDIVHGRPPASFANSGETVLTIYSEQREYLNVLSLTKKNSFLDVWGSIESFDQNQVLVPLPDPREVRGAGPVRFMGSSGESGDRLWHGVPRATSWMRGTPGQALGYLGAADMMSWPGGTVILSPDNTSRGFSFNLGVDNINTQAFGDSGLALVGLGFATGNSILITAPAGETVEGQASITLSGLPADFWVVSGRTTPTEWKVHLVEIPTASTYIV